MARIGAVIAGIILFLIAGFGYIYPINDEGWTIPSSNDLCSSGLGELGKMFSGDVRENCSLIKILTIGIYAFGLIGLILIIVGSLVPGGKRY